MNLRPLSVTLIIPYQIQDNKFFYGVLLKNTVNLLYEEGKIFIKGLDSADKYYLHEVKAPEGYNLLGEDQEVQIAASENTTSHTMTQTALTTRVNNQSGTELPSTGGMGTTIFYVAGSILLIGAAVLLITKRRMGKRY